MGKIQAGKVVEVMVRATMPIPVVVTEVVVTEVVMIATMPIPVVVTVAVSCRNYCEKGRRMFHRRHSSKSCH